MLFWNFYTRSAPGATPHLIHRKAAAKTSDRARHINEDISAFISVAIRRLSGCSSEIAKPENLQEFQRLFRSGPRRFEGERFRDKAPFRVWHGARKRMLLAMRQNVGSNPQHHSHASVAVTVCPPRNSPRQPAVRTFASIVEKGAATAKAFGAFATFVKEGTKREGRVRRFRGRVSGSLRCAGWCKHAGTRGAAR